MEKSGTGTGVQNKVLEELKLKGGIGFSYTENWVSKAIRFFRGGNFTHTFVVTSDDAKKKYIEHAIETGVYITTMEWYLHKDSSFEIFMPLDGNIDEAVEKIFGLIGTGYGYTQLIGFVFIWLMHKIRIKKSNPFGKGIICSELVWKYILALGLGRVLGEDWKKMNKDDIAPDHLYDAIVKETGLFKLVAKKEKGSLEIKVV